MKRILESMSLYFSGVPDDLRRVKPFAWFFFAAFTLFMVYGVYQTRFDMTVEGWFEDDDPTLVALDAYHAEFGSEDNVFIVYKPVDGDVFSAKSLETVRQIREDILTYKSRLEKGESSALKHVVRVNTLVDAPVLEVEGNTLISRHLVGATIPTTSRELNRIREIAEEQKTFPLFYFSKDHRYGGIVLETDFGTTPIDFETPAATDSIHGNEIRVGDMVLDFDETAVEERVRFKKTDMADYLALVKEVKGILNKPEYAGHMEYFPVGTAVSMEYNKQMLREMGFLNMTALAVMTILLWFFFRSLSAVIWPITIVVLSIIWAIGFTGWMGLTVTFFIMLTIMLLLTVGIADTVHVMSAYSYFRRDGNDHQASVSLALKKTAVACLLTSVTTMIGILALCFTSIVPFQVFALMSAAGVGFAFLLTIYLLPLMLDFWAPKQLLAAKQKRQGLIGGLVPDFSRFSTKLLERLVPIVQKSPVSIALFSLLIFGICIYGVTRLKVDSDPVEQYPKESKIRESISVVDSEMMGARNMEIYFDLGEEYAFQDPEVLNIVDELQQKIARDYGYLVVHTASLVDIVKDAYQKLNEGRPDMYVIPGDEKVLSQTLFLFNNANPDDRERLVSDDYSKSHISVRLRNGGSYEYTKTFDLIRKDIHESVSRLKKKYSDMKVSITGLFALMMQAAHYVTLSAMTSFGFALLVISVLLLFVFRSLQAGLIAIVPNLIPATFAFGLMGLLDIPLDFNTMMLAPIIIGVAVDDTIHFITQYRNEVLADGDIEKALGRTVRSAGQAIIFTSLILGLGFGILAVSSSQGTSNFGKFGSLAIFVALFLDLFLLPALISLFKFRFQREKPEKAQSGVLTRPLLEE